MEDIKQVIESINLKELSLETIPIISEEKLQIPLININDDSEIVKLSNVTNKVISDIVEDIKDIINKVISDIVDDNKDITNTDIGVLNSKIETVKTNNVIEKIIKVHQCANSLCNIAATDICANCQNDWYCGRKCQLLDWTEHKPICKMLKKLSNKLEQHSVAEEIHREIFIKANAIKNNLVKIRILVRLIFYAEFQFDRFINDWKNHSQADNWMVDITCMFNNYECLLSCYDDIESFTDIELITIKLPYILKMIEILKRWYLCGTSLSFKLNQICSTLSSTAIEAAIIYIKRKEFTTAENYCQLSIDCAEKFNGIKEMEIYLMANALDNLSRLYLTKNNLSYALKLAEDAYNCVVMEFDSVHVLAQGPAILLIEIQCLLGNFYDAERFAEMTLENFKRPENKFDQDSEDVAAAYECYANVIYRKKKGDLMKAEMLIRDAYRIRVKLYYNDHIFIGKTILLLAKILVSQGNLNKAIKLLERSLKINLKYYGFYGVEAYNDNDLLGILHCHLGETHQNPEKKEHLNQSIFYLNESLRICKKIFGPANDKTLRVVKRLTYVTDLRNFNN